jgi:hypothetical protein
MQPHPTWTETISRGGCIPSSGNFLVYSSMSWCAQDPVPLIRPPREVLVCIRSGFLSAESLHAAVGLNLSCPARV